MCERGFVLVCEGVSVNVYGRLWGVRLFVCLRGCLHAERRKEKQRNIKVDSALLVLFFFFYTSSFKEWELVFPPTPPTLASVSSELALVFKSDAI